MISNLHLKVLENRRLLFGIGIICVLISLLAIKSGYSYHRSTMEELTTYKEALRISSEVLSRGSEVENLIDRGFERLEDLEEGLLSADKPSIGAARTARGLQEDRVKEEDNNKVRKIP